ncbi:MULTISPECIES: peptide-methionine (S)-S-oxide reductase MsrA [unclassified Janthinobacterium]|uniref:peptide-methionine (S)-S-oxide reductase MsrA n=1 Tax=unclassified Janthinobacterium TaxID=2610881 RepID=UPI0016156002|nr:MULTISPECIES: peptide-methionine (S)-S-oxide reductase MsrA [unclassified Janthinobacterium]MBB5606315.1 peptide-methionine (S)-S-oxide reductase [Janthinobacterium sp. S3T4]MBB5611813.1 peptide-methionine (S)-S-oxide reductase [Janthinobacterium sp. S3M3]
MNKQSKPRASTLLKLAGGAALAAVLLLPQLPALSAEDAVVIAAPTVDEAVTGHEETAVFAGGCFWGVQGVFQHVKGVKNAVSGYTGGAAGSAHYDDVGYGNTGHAESVQVTFDPSQVSYGKLLQVFFSVAHNPTMLNRQGPDSGTQYRSAIFPATPAQRKVAEAYIAQLDASHAFKAPIVTKIEDGKRFYMAEAYHQNFLAMYPDNGYIAVNDLPKVANLKRFMPAVYRNDPVLVKVAMK